VTAIGDQRDRGTAGVDAAIAVTGLLMVAFFVVGALRIVGTGGDVDAAARAGARAAAAAYDPAVAQAAASEVVAGALADRGVACRQLAVSTVGDVRPGSVVRVDVSCTVDLGDVALVGFGASRTLNGTGVEYVDLIRGGAP
jgi:Flp pilus assembly protein TadG